MTAQGLGDAWRRFGLHRRLRQTTGRRLRDEEGSATVESVLWILMFAGLLGLITDASFAFYGRAQAVRVLQDGNRAYSTGRLKTTTEVQAWVGSALDSIVANATVSTQLVGNIVSSQAVLPVDSLTLFGMLPGDTIAIRSAHYVE